MFSFMEGYPYKIETHCHTSEVSSCSHVTAGELVRLYKNIGYDAINVSDHFLYSKICTEKGSLEKQIDWYMSGYRAAKVEGDRIGLKVYFAIELRFTENINDYLVFGVTRETLMHAREIFEMGPEKFYKFCQANKMLFYQAHPFRAGMTRPDPRFLDGMEGYNMHPGQRSRNDLASEYALRVGLLMLSGSDCHNTHQAGTGGIWTRTLPKDGSELRDLIKSGDFVMIK